MQEGKVQQRRRRKGREREKQYFVVETQKRGLRRYTRTAGFIVTSDCATYVYTPTHTHTHAANPTTQKALSHNTEIPRSKDVNVV